MSDFIRCNEKKVLLVKNNFTFTFCLRILMMAIVLRAVKSLRTLVLLPDGQLTPVPMILIPQTHVFQNLLDIFIIHKKFILCFYDLVIYQHGKYL